MHVTTSRCQSKAAKSRLHSLGFGGLRLPAKNVNLDQPIYPLHTLNTYPLLGTIYPYLKVPGGSWNLGENIGSSYWLDQRSKAKGF